MGFIIPFYIIFGTNLLTEGPVQIVVVFAYFSVSQKRNIKRKPNGIKPSRGSFLEQTQSRRLGVDDNEAARKPQGRRARPRGVGAPPTLVGPSQLHRPTSFTYIYSHTLKPSGRATKHLFHHRNLLYPWDPILGPFPTLRRRGIRSRRASTSTHLSDDVGVVYHRPSGP